MTDDFAAETERLANPDAPPETTEDQDTDATERGSRVLGQREAGSGALEWNMSATYSQEPSACFSRTSRKVPLSTGEPLRSRVR